MVNISVVGKAEPTQSSSQTPGLDPSDPFYDFFRRFGPRFPRGPQQGEQLMRGLGSGFIVNPDGLRVELRNTGKGLCAMVVFS